MVRSDDTSPTALLKTQEDANQYFADQVEANAETASNASQDASSALSKAKVNEQSINGMSSAVEGNTSNITSNTSKISINTSNIATNVTNISTNTKTAGDALQNASAADSKATLNSKSIDGMSEAIEANIAEIAKKAEIRVLTQAQYDAIPSNQLDANTLYCISD